MYRPLILDNGEDIAFHCGMLEGRTTLTACEEFCPEYSSCDTAGIANDELAKHCARGLLEIIKAAGCINYGEFVSLLYEIGALACKQNEMEKVVEALDEVYSSPGY